MTVTAAFRPTAFPQVSDLCRRQAIRMVGSSDAVVEISISPDPAIRISENDQAAVDRLIVYCARQNIPWNLPTPTMDGSF